MPRFVILRHELPAEHVRQSHWDLMLEDGPALRTWALEQQPILEHRIEGQALPDHRLAYLDYEGPVSGGRGNVIRWDRGDFDWLVQQADSVLALLHGQRLQAKIRLTRDPHTQRWLFEASATVDSATRD